MNGRELADLCKDALREAGEAEVEIFARESDRGYARFGGGELGQHMQLAEPFAVVRVAHGKRVAEATRTELTREALVEATRDAARAARHVPETEGFPGFTDRGPDLPATGRRYAARTAGAGPEERVERLAPILGAVEAAGLVSAGVLETSRIAHAVVTTRGCDRAHDSTLANFKVWALETPGAGGAAGFGGHAHTDVGALALERETERAIRICKLSMNPGSLDAGTYDVVMEPEAVAELLEWLASITFSAPEVEQGTSAVAGRLGQRITGEEVTIVEDPLDPGDHGFGPTFDREGVPKERVTLIDRGVAKGVLYDRTYAARMGARSTGSALLPEFTSPGGVGPTAIALAPGRASSVDELIEGMDRGVYVCRLHYVNGFLEPRRAVMTGLSRDGCFLVEKGKIARAVGNMRLTDSFLEGLARADGMTRARSAIPNWWSSGGVCVTPAVRMRAFRFNGRSQEKISALAK